MFAHRQFWIFAQLYFHIGISGRIPTIVTQLYDQWFVQLLLVIHSYRLEKIKGKLGAYTMKENPVGPERFSNPGPLGPESYGLPLRHTG